jgi:hypothetical protein
MKTKIIILIFTLLFFASGISAAETTNETSTGSDTLEYTLPEVIVKGDNSMSSLEKEVIRAEELKFKVFNNLNSTDDFDISCEWRAQLGTRIKKWSCDAGYMEKARWMATNDWLMGIGPFITENQLVAQNIDKTRALNKEMKTLAITHPELAIAMVNAHELNEFYKEERRKRYKDSIFVGNPPEPDFKLNKFVLWEAAFKDHHNGLMPDVIWERWDTIYRRILKIKTYRVLWKSADHKKYADEFVAYVNTIIAGR